MLKIVPVLILMLLCQMADAQYSKLHDFNGSSGGQPRGSLVSDGNWLYGMTSSGGKGGGGVLFKIKPDGSGFDTLLNFSGINGYEPTGSLIYDGIYLYGLTSQGGANGLGVLFKIKTDGSGYLKLLEFSGTTGVRPSGDLLSDGTFLYGVANQGGDNGQGTIFKIKTDGTGFAMLYSFGSNPYDGTGYSGGTLIFSGSNLYGLTNEGGSSNEGTLFKIGTDGAGYKKVFDFPGLTSDWYPEGALLSVGGFLYGVVHYGGQNSGGVIFKIKPDGTGYDTILNFKGLNGCTPLSGLITDGTYMYGTTSDGGTGTCNNGNGTVYKIKPDGTGYSKLVDFTGMTNGKQPYGSLYFDGTFLYGMTNSGGAYGDGVVFRYYPIHISLSLASKPTCGNQCKASVNADDVNGIPPFSYSWNTIPAQSTATATNLCPGKTYKVTITDKYGSGTDSITVSGIAPPAKPAICGVTVDSLSQHNIIFWDNSPYKGTGVDHFIIYREITTNNYQPIGKVSFDSMSYFIDTARVAYFPNTGNPNNGTYRYKLAAHDTCGIISDISFYHNTIYVNSNNGTFSWNLYSIEGSPNPVSGYQLLRDDNHSGNWHTVAAVSGTQLTVSDPQFASFQKTALWRVQTQWNITCTPSVGSHKMAGQKNLRLNYSLSNIYNPNGVGVDPSLNALQFRIFPDPAHNVLNIEAPQNSKVEILNIQGQLLQSFNISGTRTQADISTLPKGIFFIRLQVDNGILIQKFIKE